MKRTKRSAIIYWIGGLLIFLFLINPLVVPVNAEEPSLKPDDLVYENGNIVLHKHGERIGPDEWKVTVKATVGEFPVEKRKIEVVFLLDISGSMDATAHDHSDECYSLECGKKEHEHAGNCYNLTCGQNEHTHSDACYTRSCNKTEHEHSDYNGSCYKKCTKDSYPEHWNKNNHSGDCYHTNGKNYFYLVCKEEVHSHTGACLSLTCEEEAHTHAATCGDLICKEEAHTHTSHCYGDELACGFTDTSRFGVASRVAERLIANLPEGTLVTRLAYDEHFYSNIGSYYDIETGSGTNTWTALQKAFSGSYFSNSENKKIFVILNDGAADDSGAKAGATSLLNAFKDPNGTNGMVFSVGFAFNDSMLAEIAGNGGYYMYAENAGDLVVAFDKLEQTLTAMLEDPMGTSVMFDKTSILEIQTSGGVLSTNSDTIYWQPAEDGSDTVRNSTIEYSYTVKLNDKADLTGGAHHVALNNPTYFRYGLKGEDSSSKMKEALFPIPYAGYAFSSIQTKWQADGKDILPPAGVENIICDYASASYIPSFKQDYQTITPVIPISGTNDYYRYIGTTVTANDAPLDGVEAVDATQPVAYQVVHQYERVQSNELAVGGTKVLIGRDFLPGDSFTFVLTPVTPGAPMPEKDTVTIAPVSGTSTSFNFGTISYNAAGVYTYTIQEQAGTADKMIYDTAAYQLVVTVDELNGECVVSYTMDGVENGHLTVTNRLETGALKVEKRSVTSHLPEHQEKRFGFLISIKDSSNRPLSGTYSMQHSDQIQPLTFINGFASVQLQAGEAVVINGLPDGAAYTVTEDAAGGFVVTPEGDTGVITAGQQSTASFANTYHANGLYQFIGTKRLEDATLALDQFSFSVLDENGKVVAKGKNNTDGSFFLDTLHFTEADIGTRTYTIVEDLGNEPGILYDRTEYPVTLTIADKGDGTLSVVDDLNGKPIVFTNRFMTNQFTVSKTVAGDLGSRNREFSFTISLPDMAGQNVFISTNGGSSFESVTLNAQGQTDFTLRHGQSVIFYPVYGAYTVTETNAGSYAASYSVNNGEMVDGASASGTIGSDGGHVAFVNTLQAVTPTGVHTSSGSAIAGLCLAICLIVIITAKRRCSGLE